MCPNVVVQQKTSIVNTVRKRKICAVHLRGRLAANILNKQSWTADQEWSSSLGVWREANNLTL